MMKETIAMKVAISLVKQKTIMSQGDMIVFDSAVTKLAQLAGLSRLETINLIYQEAEAS